LGDEPGAEAVEALLMKSRRRQAHGYLSFISVMEAGYKAYQARGEDGLANLLAYIQQLPITRIDVNEELIALAARMKGAYRLSLADAWILATAKQLDAMLVHKDPEFEQASAEVSLQALPYR
jgi:predicted nucleic acid-binding protein